jgi:tetratricopeptide (TPR) repeat protein
MRFVVLVAILGASAPLVEAGQARRPAPAAANPAPDATAQAYEQFLRGHMLEEEDVDGAIAAYKRAMALDPTAAAIPADLAELYMREEKLTEAETAAQQAIRLDANNRDAHRVLGTVYATLASGNGQRISRTVQTENLNKAIQHLEQAFDPPIAEADANLRAMLARLYIAVENYDKAIPVLAELVKQEPGWSEGPNLLVQAYSAAGRASDAVTWLEENAPDNPLLYTQLGDYYARARRYADAATAFEQALAASPNSRSSDLRRRLASALMNTGNRPDALRARDVLREALAIRANDEDAMGLLSRAELAAGDSAAAETMARQLVTQNARSSTGYVALAEALEAQRKFQPIVDALVPGIAAVRATNSPNAGSIALLLTHLGFAYQELGQYDRAVATFEDAQKSAPNNPQQIAYLIQAQMLAKNYTAAAALAKSARAQRPNDLRFARLESQALRRAGKVDEGLAVMEDLLRAQGDDPDVHIALAQAYTDANRPAQAVKVLRDAQVKFPAETSVTFELGAALDKQKKYSESEALFRQLIAKDPDNAVALNYLGYMLAERGERLNESVDFLKRALAIDPDNGSFLDSIGWAYFKDGKLDLALDNLKKAAEQLGTNSVVQDHYGELLFKLGRYDDAIGAWNRALSGDGDSIDRTDIDKKIRSARQKLPRK